MEISWQSKIITKSFINIYLSHAIMDYIIKTGSNNFWSICFLQQSQQRRIHGLNKNGELRCLMFSDLLMTLQVNYCIKTLHKKITQHEKMHFACTRSELITHLQLNLLYDYPLLPTLYIFNNGNVERNYCTKTR